MQPLNIYTEKAVLTDYCRPIKTYGQIPSREYFMNTKHAREDIYPLFLKQIFHIAKIDTCGTYKEILIKLKDIIYLLYLF